MDGVCGFDIELAMSGLTGPVRLRAGLCRIAAGKSEVRRQLLRVFGAADAIEYDVAAAWVRGDVVVLEGDLRFTRADRSCMELPITLVFHLCGGLISEVQIWTYESGCLALSGLGRRTATVNRMARSA